MNKLMSILLAVLIVIAITSCGGQPQKTGEPEAQDTRASVSDDTTGKPAGMAGSETVSPYEEDTDLKELLGDDEELKRLGRFRSFAETMRLINIFGDEDDVIRQNAKNALVTQGKDAVAALIEGLSSENEDIKVYSAVTLAEIGPDAADAVPSLIDLLDSEGVRVPEVAAVALGYIGAPAADAIPKLEAVAANHPFKVTTPSGVELYPVRLAAQEAIDSIKKSMEGIEPPVVEE